MNVRIRAALIATALAAICGGAGAQAQSGRDAARPVAPDEGRSSAGATVDSTKTTTPGNAMRCISLNGVAKDRCMDEETAKAKARAEEERSRNDYGKR